VHHKEIFLFVLFHEWINKFFPIDWTTQASSRTIYYDWTTALAITNYYFAWSNTTTTAQAIIDFHKTWQTDEACE